MIRMPIRPLVSTITNKPSTLTSVTVWRTISTRRSWAMMAKSAPSWDPVPMTSNRPPFTKM